jgi:hypothetical protein
MIPGKARVAPEEPCSRRSALPPDQGVVKGDGMARSSTTGDDLLICSFCGKNQNQVTSMTQGPKRVAICNECVEVIVDMTEDKRTNE